MKKHFISILLTVSFYSLNAQVVLNEVMVNPSGAQGLINFSGNMGREYIELYNPSCTPIDVSGFFIGCRQDVIGTPTGGTFRIPSVPQAVIPPGGHIVIGTSASSSDSNNIDIKIPNFPSNYCQNNTTRNFLLGNIDGWVALYNALGAPVNAIYWSSNASNLSNASDFGVRPCVPTGSPAGTVLLSAQEINSGFSGILTYVGGNPSSNQTFSRVNDGQNWQTNIPPSISNASPTGNCNNGVCNVISTFSADATIVQPTCGQNNGSISFSPSPAGTYTYSWTPNVSSSNVANNIGANTYTVRITNTSNGCTKDTSIILNSSGVSTNPVTTFTYTTPVCVLSSTNPTPIPVSGFTTGGTYSSTAGLVINASTGEINLAASTAGTYTVTYSVAADAALCRNAGSSTFSINLTSSITPTTTFTYTTPVCVLSSTNPTPIPVSGFTTGGTYSSTAGLVINASTGEINLAASTAGTYTVTYSVAADAALCRNAGSSTFSINLTSSITPTTTFTYTTPVCVLSSTNPTPIPSAGFTTGGTYSSTSGLVINSSTGEINLAASTAGTYTVTYSVAANPSQCLLSGSSTFSINLTSSITPTTTFTYTTPVCVLSSTNSTPIPSAGFTAGGTYSSTAGLVINSSTGEINLAASASGIYTVTYSVAANPTQCLLSGSSTFSINLTGSSTPNTAFTYTTPICKNSLTISPNIAGAFTAGGIYSGSTGLVIDPNTGIIDLVASSSASHTITYTFNEDVINCISSGFSTFNITINDVPSSSIITGRTTICPNENSLVFSTSNVNGVIYNWSISGGGSIINGQGTNQITANWGSTNGTVSVELTNSCGSSSPSILNVEVGALPQVSFISGDTTVCANQLNVVYTTNPLQNTNFIWSVPVGATISSGQGTNEITVNFTSPSSGEIKVVPSNSCGNGDTFSRSILVTSAPFLELGPDENIVLGSNLILTPDVNALQPVVYSWASNPSLSSTSIANPTASPTASSTYYLTITDGNGCSTSDFKTINVESNNKFYIPNAFSPNGDSNNDLYNAFVSNFKFFELNIYNRWGEKIYSTNEPNTTTGSSTNGWDGTFKDLPQPVGVYVYILKLVFLDNSKVNQAGSVTLIR